MNQSILCFNLSREKFCLWFVSLFLFLTGYAAGIYITIVGKEKVENTMITLYFFSSHIGT